MGFFDRFRKMKPDSTARNTVVAPLIVRDDLTDNIPIFQGQPITQRENSGHNRTRRVGFSDDIKDNSPINSSVQAGEQTLTAVLPTFETNTEDGSKKPAQNIKYIKPSELNAFRMARGLEQPIEKFYQEINDTKTTLSLREVQKITNFELLDDNILVEVDLDKLKPTLRQSYHMSLAKDTKNTPEVKDRAKKYKEFFPTLKKLAKLSGENTKEVSQVDINKAPTPKLRYIAPHLTTELLLNNAHEIPFDTLLIDKKDIGDKAIKKVDDWAKLCSEFKTIDLNEYSKTHVIEFDENKLYPSRRTSFLKTLDSDSFDDKHKSRADKFMTHFKVVQVDLDDYVDEGEDIKDNGKNMTDSDKVSLTTSVKTDQKERFNGLVDTLYTNIVLAREEQERIEYLEAIDAPKPMTDILDDRIARFERKFNSEERKKESYADL
jgi:hypothetical protein